MQDLPVPFELKVLLNSGHRHTLPKGQVVHTPDEEFALAIVENGYIKRYLITNEGVQSIQSIYGPGDIFPLTPVFRLLLGLKINEGEETFYYEAMAQTKIRSITPRVLQEYSEAHPHIYKNLFYVSGMRLNSNIHNLENMSLGNSYKRLAHQLVYFSNHFGQASSEGTKILVPLTLQDLASVLNITRETVSRSMSRMKQKGLVTTGNHITVVDLEKLRKEI